MQCMWWMWLASDDSYNSRENLESNNISILWKLYSTFRLKALEMTIPMVCQTYIYHEWKRTFWGKTRPKTGCFWQKVCFAVFRRQNRPKYQLWLVLVRIVRLKLMLLTPFWVNIRDYFIPTLTNRVNPNVLGAHC